MSNVLDPSLCIVWRRGVYYWRPETGSRWRGDPDDRTWVPALDWPPNAPVPPDLQASAPGQTEQSPPRQRQPPGNRRLRGNQCEEEIARAPARHDVPLHTPARHDVLVHTPQGIVETRSPPPYDPRGAFASSRNHPLNPYANGPVEFRGPAISPDEWRQGAPSGQVHRAPYWSHGQQPSRTAVPQDDWETRDHRHVRREAPHRHDVDAHTRGQFGQPRPHGWDRDRLDRRDQRDHCGAPCSEERDLRERALQTKPRKPSIAVTRPVPLVDNTAVDAEGYPVFPLSAPTDDDASDYGGSEADDSGSDGARARQDIMNKERARLEDAHNWRTRTETARTKLLTQWCRAGCPKADVMVKHIVWVYCQYPLLRRSVGTLYLMRHMREGSAAYLFAATGDPTPLSRRDGRMPVPRNMCREFAVARRAGSSSTTTLLTSGTGTSGDEPMPAAPSAPAPYTHNLTQSYIGFSPAPEGEHADRMGPQAALRDVIAHLEQMPPARWARGIRDDSGFWPAPEAPAGISPHVSDLMALCLIYFLSPARDAGGTSIHHSRWRGMVLNVFAVPGLYERHVGIGGWIGAFAPLERYPFDTLNMSLSEALQWVHAHGVPADSDMLRVLHDYAASWRNSREDSGDSRNVDFAGDYPSPASTWPIRHGMLRVGARSVYPQSPGTTPVALAPVPEGEDSEMAVVHPAEEGKLQDGSGTGSASVTQGGA
ncbi:hypothetical protein K438DRAFT_2119715 [Mycena galopus ATCC 62051]|nr:hypothetical protein K438DRAFT_2119715 [Mycena galopus ATCC 62051]